MTVGSPGHICAFAGVNNKGDHHNHHHRHIGPVPVMVVTMVMVIAYCYGPRTHTCPAGEGVLPGDIPIRGAAQHFATVRPENKVCRVCGSHPAVWASGPKARSARACAGWRQRRRCEPVCTWFAGLHPGRTKNGQIKTQCWRGFAADSAGWVAEIGPRALNGLTQRTQLT